jgi:putative SOS response-associated peptidase YedK
MCGRYRRKSDKQRVAEAFGVTAGLDGLDLAPDEDAAPGSIQPVVSINQDGERQFELMRWGFKLPDRLLFNARSEGIETSKFWKDDFLKGRIIVPADAIFEWKEMPKGQKKPKYEFTFAGQAPFGMAGVWKLWKNPNYSKVNVSIISDIFSSFWKLLSQLPRADRVVLDRDRLFAAS